MKAQGNWGQIPLNLNLGIRIFFEFIHSPSFCLVIFNNTKSSAEVIWHQMVVNYEFVKLVKTAGVFFKTML
jgi:hypothetical protein